MVVRVGANIVAVTALLLAIGCMGSQEKLADLYLSTAGSGSGKASVSRSVAGSGCGMGICVDGVGGNHGSTTMAYDPGASVTLVATPYAGSTFVNWVVTVYAEKGPPETVTSTDATFVVGDTGDQMDVVATFSQ
jgi:hypothetical protein